MRQALGAALLILALAGFPCARGAAAAAGGAEDAPAAGGAGGARGDAPGILPLAQVKPGMTGYGLTVMRGTKIERFGVRVMGILRGGPASDLILFRATGPVIQEAGGTASGMSGSPIYVGGRVIGALSYGYHFAGVDADLSLATPIEDMLKLWRPESEHAGEGLPPAPRLPAVYRAAAPIPTPLGRLSQVLLVRSTSDAAAYNARRQPDTIAMAPAAVPLFASGFSPRAMAVLTRALARYNVVPMQGYGGTKDFTPPPVEPGSALGVELARGDIEIGAIGTVTYRSGSRILAFGHPLLNAGPAAMPLSAAWINTVVRSIDFPFKEGSIGRLVGTATNDRGTGMSGDLGRLPRMFGIRVRVQDGDRPVRESDASVVLRGDLAEALVPAVALSAVQRSFDRVSGGSAKVRIALRVKGLSKDIVREDLAYDVADIATASVLDVPSASQLLFGNFFKTLDPIDMTIDISMEPQPNTALLVAANTSDRTVSPGQRVRVQVGLFPYGGRHRLTRTVQFTIPRDFPPGPAFLLVGSPGTLNDPSGLPPDQKFQTLVQQQGTPQGNVESLADAIDQFEDVGKNTEVLVELLPAPVLQAVGGNANPGFQSQAGTSVATDAVVLGRFQIPIVVK